MPATLFLPEPDAEECRGGGQQRLLANPMPAKPLFTITAANVEQYKANLAPGQYAMFKRYPETFKMPVYPSHRGAAVPDDVSAAIKRNATNAKLVGVVMVWKTSIQRYRSRFLRVLPKSSGTTLGVIVAVA